MSSIFYGTKRSRSDRWTSSEDDTLIDGYKKGYTYAKLMRITSRGFNGIKTRLRFLKVCGRLLEYPRG